MCPDRLPHCYYCHLCTGRRPRASNGGRAECTGHFSGIAAVAPTVALFGEHL